MNREEGINFLNKKVLNRNLVKHCLAVGAIMKELAGRFQENQEEWELAGILHDIDYEETKNDPQKHSIIGAEYLKSLGLGDEFCEAVKAHNESHKIAPKSLMAKALFVCDPLSGLIVAATLVLPSKKISDLTPENVLNRFNEKLFAKGANRETIKKCQDYLNLSLEEFARISLEAMKKISNKLEL